MVAPGSSVGKSSDGIMCAKDENYVDAIQKMVLYLPATAKDCGSWGDAWAVAENVPIVEGIVLKRVKAKLEMGRSADNNGLWMIRCRMSTKNFQF